MTAYCPALARLAALVSGAARLVFRRLARRWNACWPLQVNVEIKQDESETASERHRSLAREVVTLLAARKGAPRIVVTSFSLSAIDAVSASEPGLATGIACPSGRQSLKGPLDSASTWHGGLHPFFLSVDGTW